MTTISPARHQHHDNEFLDDGDEIEFEEDAYRKGALGFGQSFVKSERIICKKGVVVGRLLDPGGTPIWRPAV
jgi:hypothetical protein